MEGQSIWLSRTITLGPTTLVTQLQQLAQFNQCHLQRRRKALDFEGYATFHKEQHTILEGLNEYGYAGMDEGSKTRHLHMSGIKTTALDSVKTQILCNAELR